MGILTYLGPKLLKLLKSNKTTLNHSKMSHFTRLRASGLFLLLNFRAKN